MRMKTSLVFILLSVAFSGCGYEPEVRTLLHVEAPDARHSARLDYIIGGPPIGGAVVWQELRVVTPVAKVYPSQSDTMLVLTANEEKDSPAVSVQWLSSNQLLVTPLRSSPITPVNSNIDGVQILYAEPKIP
jgi:hypothetical protein